MTRIFCILFILASHMVSAQRDTVYALPEVEVAADRDPFPAGWAGNLELAPGDFPIIVGQSIAELPFLQLPSYNSYGPGRLTTLGVRGTSGRQVGVFWQEIPIQSPMLGIADLGLLTPDPGTRIRLTQGVWSAGKGIGASAGALNIDEQYPDSVSGIQPKASVRIGSYGERVLGAGLEWNSQQVDSRVVFNYGSAENNYPYDHFGQERSLPNASYSMPQAKALLRFKLSDTQMLEIGSWWMQYRRGIPPTRLQNRSLAVESGDAWRNFIRHRWTFGRAQLSSLAAYTDESFSYQDPILELDQTNRSRMFFFKQKMSVARDRWWLKGGWEWQYARAFSPNYALNANISRGAIQMDASAILGKWTTDILLRQEVSNSSLGRPIVNLRMTRSFADGANFFSGIGTFFRWPAMDDLYWTPGGNPELAPEHGWQTEGGIIVRKTALSSVDWEYSLTAYYRKQFDAIQWYPDGQFWTVRNLGILESYGLIIHGSWSRSWGTNMVKAQTNIQVTRSDELTDGDDLQQIYVPLLASFLNLSIAHKKWKIQSIHHYRSRRYFLNSAQSFLPGVMLHHFFITRSFNLKQYEMTAQAGVQNLLGTDHEWVIDRPMPGRTFHLSLIIR